MLTTPVKTSVEVARKRINTRDNNGVTQTFRNIALRDIGSYAPGIEFPADEQMFADLNEGDHVEVVLYWGTRSVDARGRTGNMYHATVPAGRIVDYKVTKAAPVPVSQAA